MFFAPSREFGSTQAQVRAGAAQLSEAETALHDISLITQFDGELVKKRIELGSCVRWSTWRVFSRWHFLPVWRQYLNTVNC